MTTKIILSFLISFLLGSIPTAYIFVKKIKGQDIRELGSHNVGGTNAIRVLGFKTGISVLLLDVLKGAVATIIAALLIRRASYILYILAAYMSIAGHIFTPFLNGHGGKGVATSAGVYVILAPYAVLASAAIFLILFFLTKIVSISSIVAIVSLDILLIIFKARPELITITILLSIIIIIMHRRNLKKIYKGDELSFKK